MFEKEKEIERLRKSIDYGKVVKYRRQGDVQDTYLVVQEIADGFVRGQMAVPVGVNSISLDELIEQEGLSISDFREFKNSDTKKSQ